MSSDKADTSNAAKRFVLRLFVAGDAPNSRIAKENLRRLRERATDSIIEIEEVDILKNPQSVIDYGIYLTPAIQVVEPGPGTLIYGNLNDEEALRTLLT